MSNLAIITGASRGIGRATAARFLDAGWEVWNLSRSACDLEGVVNYQCDLGDLGGLEAQVAALDLTPYQKISLIHNAGVTRRDSYATADSAAMLEIFRVNVMAPQTMNRVLISRLPEGSSVVFIGSTLSEEGAPQSLSYVVSKHALAGLMKSTCQDLVGKEIHACLVCPGFTDTSMLEGLFPDRASLETVVAAISLGQRMAKPQEVAETIFFAATSAILNGSVIHANLGQK